MKVPEEEKERRGKSWSISLRKGSGPVELKAVDSETGKPICNLVHFVDSGIIKTAGDAYGLLESYGYDPHEHGNDFDDDGAIIVKSFGDCLM